MRVVLNIIVLVISVIGLEYQKNKDIKMTKKYSVERINNITDEKVYKDKIENIPIIMFYFFARHVENQIEGQLKQIKELSKYEMMSKVDFSFVNCTQSVDPSYKSLLSLCSNMFYFPTIKIYYRGKEIKNNLLDADLESMLEYFDKLSMKSIINLYDFDNVEDFTEKYGETSFLIVDHNSKSRFYKCVNSLAEEEYKTYFYFGFLELKEFKNIQGFKLPGLIALGLNKPYNIYIPAYEASESSHNESPVVEGHYATYDCNRIKSFIEENRFPLFKKLDNKYLKKLSHSNKILILAVIHGAETSHIKFLKDCYHNFSLKYRQFVFSYINVKDDLSLIDYFKLDISKIVEKPQIVSYNFESGTYYVKTLEAKEVNNYTVQMEELMYQIANNLVSFSSGYFLEDLLVKMGIQKNRRLILMGGFIFFVFIILFFFVLFLFGCFETLSKLNLVSKNQKKNKNQTNKNKLEHSKVVNGDEGNELADKLDLNKPKIY